MTTTIEIARDFSDVPAGRYAKDGQYSGQRFREEFLKPKLLKEERVEVVLDDVEGYGSSFLEEAFGGLVRIEGFTSADLHRKLTITAKSDPYKIYASEIWSYIDTAKRK